MRSLVVSLLALAACARAQSIVGTYYIPSDGDNVSGIIPDVSVIGLSTITDSSHDDGDVGVMTIQTAPNPTTTTTEPACVFPLVAIHLPVLITQSLTLFVDPPL